MSRLLPPAMRAALDQGVTHFCYCWHIKRRDGLQLGLTDHDRDIQFNEIAFHAQAGISLSALDARLGLDAARPEAQGVLSHDYLTEADLAAGLYDEARFDLWLVDWQAPENRMLVMVGQFGSVHLIDQRFTVGLAPQQGGYDAPRGRLFQKTCDAVLGDARCRAPISAPPFRFRLRVQALAGGQIETGAVDRPNGWFAHGTIETPGGRKLMVRADHKTAQGRRLSLWQDGEGQLQLNDEITVTAGCDKRLGTCQHKFKNAVNYQGFPDLSDDKVLINVESRD